MKVQYLMVDADFYRDDLGNVEGAIETGGYVLRQTFSEQYVY